MTAAEDLDRHVAEYATMIKSPHVQEMIKFANEFNGDQRAGHAVKLLLAAGVDPSTVIKSGEGFTVSYHVDTSNDGGLVSIIKDVSVHARIRRERFTVFYGPVLTVSRDVARELVVDLVRDLANSYPYTDE